MPEPKEVESINKTIRKCCWVKSKPGTVPPVYCGKETRWHWAVDEDGQRYHNYSTLCTEHILVQQFTEDRRKLFLGRILAKAERNGISPEDILPVDCEEGLDEMHPDDLDKIWRSMGEMDD